MVKMNANKNTIWEEVTKRKWNQMIQYIDRVWFHYMTGDYVSVYSRTDSGVTKVGYSMGGKNYMSEELLYE